MNRRASCSPISPRRSPGGSRRSRDSRSTSPCPLISAGDSDLASFPKAEGPNLSLWEKGSESPAFPLGREAAHRADEGKSAQLRVLCAISRGVAHSQDGARE